MSTTLENESTKEVFNPYCVECSARKYQAEIYALRKKGMTFQAIANRYKTTPSSIHRSCQRYLDYKKAQRKEN